MKRLMLLLLFAATAAATLCAQQLFVGTYNIRNNDNDDAAHGNGWQQRVSVICGQVNFEQPDVFGTQEVLHSQVLDLKAGLTGYDYIGVGRDDGKQAGEYECIWYNTATTQLLDQGHFWLSETPDKPGLGWDAACIRICSWGKFRQLSTGFTFFYLNLHMDHVGIVARREAAKLVVKRLPLITGGAPAILTGDFNVDQNNEIYQTFTTSGLLIDCFTHAQQRFAENGTFNAFHPELKTDSRIDHIFVSPAFSVDHYAIMTNCYWTELPDQASRQGANAPRELRFRPHQQRTPSDHYPVWAKISLNKEK